MQLGAAFLAGVAVPSSSRHQYRSPASQRTARLCVQAVAAPASPMKVFQAESMDEAALREFTSRPRIDFTSILGTVGGPGGVGSLGCHRRCRCCHRHLCWDFHAVLPSGG